MAGDALDAAVQALMRRVAAEVVMPHFRALAAEDIEEKGPGDLVTVADRLSEESLADGLAAILPDARMIGEEGAAADPTLLDGIERGVAWIVDPIDGTGNYAAGRTPFAIMVALAADGVVEAGWILDPLTGRMIHAARGRGAFVDGEPVRSRETGAALPLVGLATRYLPPASRAKVDARIPGRIEEAPIPLCSGEQYPRVALGRNDACLFWRALPWDHAPGALFLAEAGGRIARLDGAPYRLGDDRLGLIAAATPAMWDRVAAVLGDDLTQGER